MIVSADFRDVDAVEDAGSGNPDNASFDATPGNAAQPYAAVETESAADAAARDARTFQVADHGVDSSPVPPAPSVAIAAELADDGSRADAGIASAGGRGRKAHAAAKSADDRFTLHDFFLWCGVPVLIVLLIRLFLVGFYEIPSRSMMDTVVPGDRVVASKITTKISGLQRGDVVVFKDPNNWLSAEQSSGIGGGYLIKRLIGMPGDVVECKGAGQPITINGVAINETSYIRPGVDPSSFPFSVTVTEGHVFVMGDNRANSADSRYHQDDADHGLVPISDVVGTAFVRYWPLNRIAGIDAHHEVFADVPDASVE
ncbi:signal peptidase I [Bifidobacterium sp. SO4]|nr:signal peptidase I [Bifidobacterium sp. SO4]